jgi:hypothetical protein
MVTRFHRRDHGADRLHNTGAFMAEDHRHFGREIAVPEVNVGMADPDGLQPDEDFARTGLVDGDLFY